MTRHRAGAPLSFGYGTHYCIGASLARLEGDVVYSEMLRRYPRMELAAEPTRQAPSGRPSARYQSSRCDRAAANRWTGAVVTGRLEGKRVVLVGAGQSPGVTMGRGRGAALRPGGRPPSAGGPDLASAAEAMRRMRRGLRPPGRHHQADDCARLAETARSTLGGVDVPTASGSLALRSPNSGTPSSRSTAETIGAERGGTSAAYGVSKAGVRANRSRPPTVSGPTTIDTPMAIDGAVAGTTMSDERGCRLQGFGTSPTRPSSSPPTSRGTSAALAGWTGRCWPR